MFISHVSHPADQLTAVVLAKAINRLTRAATARPPLGGYSRPGDCRICYGAVAGISERMVDITTTVTVDSSAVQQCSRDATAAEQ